MSRHRVTHYPEDEPTWVKETKSPCLRSIAEEVYDALNRVIKKYNGNAYTQSKQLIAAGDKERRTLENASYSDGVRCKAGERALRKYWEAKVAARRVSGYEE